ncbi:hypothetical protein ACF0H5_014118 [Mactra antiquata]
MATSLKNVLQIPITYSRARILQQVAVQSRSSHSNCKDEDNSSRIPKVGMSDDGRTLIGWHPEPEHPYEHTKPINYDSLEAKTGSILQDSVVRNYETRYRPLGPNTAELANVTFTTKHKWFPKREKKYRKRNPPKDREGI